ncbi:MAG: hypothetical protein A3J58_01845 [Candidatus Sungbacteria bacterium RIFCSPHIGHO2_02_FULL_52_23]|uniref:phosphoribosylglycinamide formyltransferase 1 n=1 Tax=Candidatus Sungbacteria bacterium RIFCSPHIGHO2_02_FULL_52_23 TaxID=1802274 RepID=A0A1G2KSD8_9BACT|nr:MAG: hypothetical protein A3J58_01845 [Candidatus Sungbacteria bacterium RIFCSPHIGHO2_02_FULL_52_23]
MLRRNVLVLASGTSTGGGSGAWNLGRAVEQGILRANIVGIVSQYPDGGTREMAMRLEYPFFHFPPPWTAARYQELMKKTRAEFYILSGWNQLVRGLDPSKTINKHPAPLPEYGGRGWWGYTVHERMIQAYRLGEVQCSAVTFHFVIEAGAKEQSYDKGPIICTQDVPILAGDTADDLSRRVRAAEYLLEPLIVNQVITEKIRWSGNVSESVHIPRGFLVRRPVELLEDPRLIF